MTDTNQPNPVTSHDCDPAEGNRRAAFLEFLYVNDGRHRPEHPMHGLFTGLYVEYRERLCRLNDEVAP